MKETEIIKLFQEELKSKVLGDDAGFIKLGDRWLLLTNDMLVWRTDVPDFMTPEEAGAKVVTMNVSDIAAMGGKPIGFFFSLGLPRDINEKTLREIAKGIKRGTKRYNVEVLSGDTNESNELVIDGGAIGEAERILLRSGAKPGEVVCVTGDLGRPLTALLLWLKGEKIPREIAEKMKNPIARVREGLELANYASSAIDISDGLSKELWEISKASKVKIVIDPNSLPVHEKVKEIVKNPVEVALASGEEFELVFTISQEYLDILSFEFSIIGRVEKGEGVYTTTGEKVPMRGWEHFAGGNNDIGS